MSNLSKLGRIRDIKTRIHSLRVFMYDNVVKARKLIYEKANSVIGSGVDGWLKEISGVPTMVSDQFQESYSDVALVLIFASTECIC